MTKLYASYRPRDRIVNAGLAAEAGTLRYHRFEEAALNGCYGQNLADEHRSKGFSYLGSSELPCIGVGDFLKSVPTRVDLLNLDVETMDAEILGAWDCSVCRPSAICVEIHAADVRSMLINPITEILDNTGYVPVCRGLMSTIFVDADHINR